MAIFAKTVAPILSATVACTILAPAVSQARIVRLEITETKPAFGGRNFGEVGVYERVIGKTYGEVDPAQAANAMIQDIALAPKNAKGMVEYSTVIDILRPDARPSIEERYPSKEAYVVAFKKAANDLVARRFLLADDAARLISEAERDGIRSAP